jgi:hypothetical protein
MAEWEIVVGSREYEPAEGRGTTVGWAFELERAGVRRPITVEVARELALADKRNAPIEVRQALTTRGSSAVMAVIGRDAPPRKLVVELRGISEFD